MNTTFKEAERVVSELLVPFLSEVKAEVVVLLAGRGRMGSSLISKVDDVYKAEYWIESPDLFAAIDSEVKSSGKTASAFYLKRFEDEYYEFMNEDGERRSRRYESIYAWYIFEGQFFPVPADEVKVIHQILNRAEAGRDNTSGPYTRYHDSWDLFL